MRLLELVSVTCHFIIWTVVVESKGCRSPQYIEVGTTGIIQCSFPEDVYNLYWYNSTNLVHENTILTLKNSVKSGQGFVSGEFDIYQNGSLIITNVSMKHEGTYTIISLDTPASTPTTYTVSVSVIADTFNRIPLISKCSPECDICFQIWGRTSEISCIVRDARPAIHLSWSVRTTDGDHETSQTLLLRNETHPFVTSQVTLTNPFAHLKMLTLLICKADSPPGLLERDKSLLLLLNSVEIFKSVKPQGVLAESHSSVHLNCTDTDILYLVWQVKQSPEEDFKTILYAVFEEGIFSHTNDDDFTLQNTSIFLDNVKSRHEGTYRCINGNGLEDNVTMFDIEVFAYPNPAHLVVDGCDHQQYCVLPVQHEGSMACKVKMIRPRVDLDITEVFEPSSYPIYIYDKKITIKDNVDTFDVLLTSKFRFIGPAESRRTLQCKVVGTNIDELNFSTKFDLLFVDDGLETTTKEDISSSEHYYWLVAVVIVIVLVLLGTFGFVLLKRSGEVQSPAAPEQILLTSESNTSGSGEVQSPAAPEQILLTSESNTSGKKDIFISELKAKYQDLYDAIQPIPYIRDRLCCVDKVFVEGGIEYLVAKDRIGGQGTWVKLSSYHNILDDDRVKSKRRILEGEPGYGKSTLTLQLSYDWCNEIPLSYLKDIDVLILLRLRQLGGVTSVYRAMKQFLLPKDSKLTESDIADIISECSSVLVILDGYDEYPDQDVDVDSDVINIIMRNMFQQFEVILTTRSSYLPKKYPALTKRLKLTGFDENARDQYIRKAVVGDDVKAAEKINQRLKENPVLGDLCQVPLFFVMFAHMSHESEQTQKFISVTSFFRYMISCFHSHMKNKMEDENVKKYDLFETEHTELDKLAFEGLSRKDQQIVWSKQCMCERLGQDFYDQYVRTGILIEEEVLDISDDPNAIISEHIQYKTEVRFYHKLFCEWYAAHHLSEYASRDDVTFDPWKESESEISDSDSMNNDNDDEPETRKNVESQTDHYLKYLDPFDLQYVYRFTCGLNLTAADKIIGYLKTREKEGKFAILCIFERRGKMKDVLRDVEDFCSHEVRIDDDDTLLLQRSTIQLLKIALANEISISRVFLFKCCRTVDLRGGNHLQLKSSLSIPVLTTLNTLWIREDGREITSEEFTGILQYSSKCLELKELQFGYCLLPQSVQAECVSVLRSRNVKVIWRGYQLNLQSGHWEHKYGSKAGKKVTDKDYQQEVKYFREKYGKC